MEPQRSEFWAGWGEFGSGMAGPEAGQLGRSQTVISCVS